MKQKKLIFNFFVNRNLKKLTDSRKRAQILADNRKSHHPIETLLLLPLFILNQNEKWEKKVVLITNISLNTDIIWTGKGLRYTPKIYGMIIA